MALYHQAPYTIETDRQIVDAAPLSSGLDEASSDLVVIESTARVVDDFTLTLSKSGLVATAVIHWGDEAPGTAYVATVDWGDGSQSLASNVATGNYSETHTYPRSGSYTVTVNLSPRPAGRPSLQRSGLIVV